MRAGGSGGELGGVGRPGPRHELVDTLGGPKVDELGEDVGEVGLRIGAVELAGFDERSDAGPILGAEIVAGEQRVLAIEHNAAVILPMSGRMLWSDIAGIRCTDSGCVGFRASVAHRVSWYTSSLRRAP